VNKKKYPTEEDNKDWLNFTKNLKNVEDKDINLNSKDISPKNTKKLDLHGYTLSEANDEVKKFINESYEKNYKKILVITGKGLRSKAYQDPYRSNNMSILKNSVPDFIKNDKTISNKIIKISNVKPHDGGEGAFYIFLKNKFR
jgi:DNA-nicking Smr family endonuclease